MPAPTTAVWNLPVNVGQDLALQFAWAVDDAPVDLTGYTALWQFGKRVDTPVLLAFSTDDAITIDGEAGTITLTLTGTDTEAFTKNVRYHLLVLTSPDGVEIRLLEGSVQRFAEFTSE
jgi:hypothetical protein